MDQKKRFYAEAVPNEWLVVFTHDHYHPWGYVEAGEKGKYTLREMEKATVAETPVAVSK